MIKVGNLRDRIIRLPSEGDNKPLSCRAHTLVNKQHSQQSHRRMETQLIRKLDLCNLSVGSRVIISYLSEHRDDGYFYFEAATIFDVLLGS